MDILKRKVPFTSVLLLADKVGICWGIGSGIPNDPSPWEGELRNLWKSTRQEALWFHGGLA